MSPRLELPPPELGVLHHGFDYFKYDSFMGLRASDLHGLKRSPAHWKAGLEEKNEETDALRIGKIVHAALENGPDFLSKLKVMPKFTGLTKEGKESAQSLEARVKKSNWLNDLPEDAHVVSEEEQTMVAGMLNAATKHRLVGNLLKNGVRETSLWVEDPETGVILKWRPDFISKEGYLIDIKTTRDASPGFFLNEIFSDRYSQSPYYALQAAHYAHCARLTKVCNGDSFTIIAIEKEAPYGIRVYPLDFGCLGPAEQWRAHLTKQYAECVRKNEFPGYPQEAGPVVPPEWSSMPPGEEG